MPRPARVYVDAGVLLYVGPGVRADEHAHHAVQLVIGCDGELELGSGRRRARVRAGLVPARTPHTLDATGATIALLLVDAHGPRGVALDARARRERGRDVFDEVTPLGLPDAAMSPRAALAWCEAVVAALGAGPPRAALGAISRRALAYIAAHLDGVPRLTGAAAALGLSPTRLTHVFTREVGLPFRRYVLWARLQRAIAALQQGADLTSAAFRAGFADGAHLSRTFRATFGLTPSQILARVSQRRPGA